MRKDPTACRYHHYTYVPNDCYDCVNAELAWIRQTALSLVERGYPHDAAWSVASEWAADRRRGWPLNADAVLAQTILKQPVYRH